MHKYLRSVGFSGYMRHKEIQSLLDEVYKAPDNIEVSDLLDSTFITMEKNFSTNMGIGIFGEYDDTDRFQIEYYYPYYKSSVVSSNACCSISRHADRYAFSVMSEEYRFGISLIFYLQNTNGYLDCVSDRIPLNRKMPIRLNAMSNSGCILLPLRKTASERKQSLVMSRKRVNLIESARNGDESAMESLTMYDIDQYNQAAMRIQHEDLYSIVDTCFMPTGMECDQYSILGDILEMEELNNIMTGEVIYHFLIECNDVQFSLIINKKDLMGEPAVGRRFKGDVWLQGYVDFPEEIQ
ncbi:MAG: DUF3881 family protein [Lachnospiraceae bacterium]|nr:DUF3881 family protein [Lachnospiraceae bacterium]